MDGPGAVATVPTVAMGRAVLAVQLFDRAPAAAASWLDGIVRAAVRGDGRARRASIACASAIIHARAGGDASALDAIRDAASAASLELVVAVLAEVSAHKRLLRAGRLSEVGIGVDRLFQPQPPGAGSRYRHSAWGSAELQRMLRHHDPRYVRRLLAQRWIRREDVLVIASRRPSVPGISLAIALDDRWVGLSEVREALVLNPFSATSLVLALLPTMPAVLLGHLRDAGDAHPLVGHAARLLLEAARTSAPVGVPAPARAG